jgi:hypothetical protein
MLTVNSWEISTWPRAQLCPRFGDINICRVAMLNGIEMEILFTAYGYPLVDATLISLIQQYYHKRFIPIQIDSDLAYANIVTRKRNIKE